MDIWGMLSDLLKGQQTGLQPGQSPGAGPQSPPMFPLPAPGQSGQPPAAGQAPAQPPPSMDDPNNPLFRYGDKNAPGPGGGSKKQWWETLLNNSGSSAPSMPPAPGQYPMYSYMDAPNPLFGKSSPAKQELTAQAGNYIMGLLGL